MSVTAAATGEVRVFHIVAYLALLRVLRLGRNIDLYVHWDKDCKAAGMSKAEYVIKSVFGRYMGIILRELTAPIFIAGFTMCQAVLKRIRIMELVGDSMETVQPVVRTAVVKILEQNKFGNNLVQNQFIGDTPRRRTCATYSLRNTRLTMPSMTRMVVSQPLSYKASRPNA